MAGIAAVAVAAVVLAGCGGDGQGWPTGGAASSTAAPPPEPTPTTETSVPSSPAAGTSSDGEQGEGGVGAGGGQSGDGGAAPSRCTTTELKASLGRAEGTAGSVHQTLILTNTGGRTCTLRGFPGVSYTQGSGLYQLGPSAAMVGPRGDDVRLGPGGSAGADLKLTDVRNYDPAVCRPAPSNALRVYPPGDTASLIVVRDGTGCAGTPPGNQLEIATLRAR